MNNKRNRKCTSNSTSGHRGSALLLLVGLSYVVPGVASGPTPSDASDAAPDETFVAIETPMFDLTLHDVLATVTFMADWEGVWHCTTEIVAEASRKPNERTNNAMLEFKAPCEDIYREKNATFDLRSKRERKAGAIEGSFTLRENPAEPSRDAWTIFRIATVSETVSIESSPDCTLSGTYAGYGLSYINRNEDANYPIDVSMRFHARVITEALFNNLPTRCERSGD